MTKNKGEVEYRKAHNDKVMELIIEESEWAQKNRKPFADPGHVAITLYEEILEAYEELLTIYFMWKYWFEKCVRGNLHIETKEVLDEIRKTAGNVAAESTQIGAVADKALETFKKWRDE